MNRIKLIMCVWASVILYLAFTRHTPIFCACVIGIAFLVGIILTARVMDNPNESERKTMDKITNIAKNDGN